MDAVRVSDGSFVLLKKITKSYHPYEAEIGQYLSTEAMRTGPRNHSVPILDVLQPEDDDGLIILVMPLLRNFDEPSFGTLGEVVDCVKQAFEVCQAIP
jgi:hypothetical protein